MHPLPHRVLFAAAAVLACGSSWILADAPAPVQALKDADATPSPREPLPLATDVRVQPLVRQDLVKTLAASGRLRSRRELLLSSRIPGILDSLCVGAGSRVRAGDLLVRLVDHEYRLAFESARLALLGAQIEFQSLSSSPYLGVPDSARRADLAVTAGRRRAASEEALRRGLLSAEAYRRIRRDCDAQIAYATAERSDVIALRSGLMQASEALERATINLEATELRAPFDAVVADCALTPGAQVLPGMPLLRLIDEGAFVVDLEIAEPEVGRITPGMPAAIEVLAYPERRFTGRVCERNPLVDAQSGTAVIRIRLETPARLDPPLYAGMYATAALETGRLRRRLVVPRQAVLLRDEKAVVFTLCQGSARWHYVRQGEANSGEVEILAGLAEGDTVIVDGQLNLVHGAPVHPRDVLSPEAAE